MHPDDYGEHRRPERHPGVRRLDPTGIGYYQINVQVPANAPSGIQPVIVTANGVAAKTVYLAIQ